MKDRINTGRQLELDVARVVAIFYMVIVHVYEEMGAVNYWSMPDSFFRGIIEFTGGPLAAPVFMFVMGVGMVYTKHRNPRAFAIRGLKLLGASYLLNVIRMTIPFLLARLSGDSWGYWTIVDTIGLVDILQFAGVAFLLVALLEKWKVGRYWILSIALLLQGLGIVLLHSFDGLPRAAQYAVGLVFHTNSNVCFPLSLWFVYPAAGIVFGEYLQTVRDKRRMYGRIAVVSAAGLAGLTVAMKYMGWDPVNVFALSRDSYYIQHLPGTLWTLFAVGLQLFICYRISLHLSGAFLKATDFTSRHVNTVYLIQWVLIPYIVVAMEAAGQPRLPAWAIVPSGILIAGVSIWLAKYIRVKL